MTISAEWTQIAAICAVLAAVGGIGLLIIRSSLGAVFAERKALETVSARIGEVEKQLAGAPTGEDMRGLYDRMRLVEVGVAQAGTAIGGVSDGMKRVENMLSLLVQNELEKGKRHEPG